MTTTPSDSIARLLLKSSKYRAKKAGIKHTLKLQDIRIPEWCPVLGIRLKPSKGRAGPSSPSLDRIDPTKGYVPGNVVIVSWRANEIKKDSYPDELDRVASFYRQLHDYDSS